MKRWLIIVFVLFTCGHSVSHAQTIGLKTNALYWATSTPNLGLEFAVGKRFTIAVDGGYNPWTFDKDAEVNRKFKHLLVGPEVRYWFCDAFQGHFIGLNARYSLYNISAVKIPFVDGSSDRRYQGWAAGAGVTYGYSWIIGKRWNMEATFGYGWWYTVYDRYENSKCGLFQETCPDNFFAPTRIGLSFIYLLK